MLVVPQGVRARPTSAGTLEAFGSRGYVAEASFLSNLLCSKVCALRRILGVLIAVSVALQSELLWHPRHQDMKLGRQTR